MALYFPIFFVSVTFFFFSFSDIYLYVLQVIWFWPFSSIFGHWREIKWCVSNILIESTSFEQNKAFYLRITKMNRLIFFFFIVEIEQFAINDHNEFLYRKSNQFHPKINKFKNKTNYFYLLKLESRHHMAWSFCMCIPVNYDFHHRKHVDHCSIDHFSF